MRLQYSLKSLFYIVSIICIIVVLVMDGLTIHKLKQRIRILSLQQDIDREKSENRATELMRMIGTKLYYPDKSEQLKNLLMEYEPGDKSKDERLKELIIEYGPSDK